MKHEILGGEPYPKGGEAVYVRRVHEPYINREQRGVLPPMT